MESIPGQRFDPPSSLVTFQRKMDREERVVQIIGSSNVSNETDDSYFGEDLWSVPVNTISVHESHLKDTQRVLSYWNGIINQSHLFQGKVVLDISHNSGLYSSFAVRVGALKCYVVEENAENAALTQRILNLNGYDDHCQVLVKKLENIEWLEIPKVDVIIHECMGDFVIASSTIKQAIVAREVFLKETGVMLPYEASLFVSGINDKNLKSCTIDFWESPVCGFDMGCFREMALREPEMTFVHPEDLTTAGSFIHRFNFSSIRLKDLGNPIETSFIIKNRLPGADIDITAIMGYMKVDFLDYDSENTKGGLSTSPSAPYTGWEHCVFPLDKVRKLKGRYLVCHFSLRMEDPKDLRGVQLQLNLKGCSKNEKGETYTFYEPKRR